MPQPTVAQVKQRISELNVEAGRLGQQYDQAMQELSSAGQRLRLVDGEAARYQARFRLMRAQVAQIAATAYEDGGLTSPVALLTAGDPQQILDQSSILQELTASNSHAMRLFIADARRLAGARESARRTRDAIVALKDKLGRQKKHLGVLLARQRALLAQLTPAQQAGTGPGAGTGTGAGGGSGGYTGPTSTQAEKAVAYAYNQLGCPYVYGGIGPCSSGFDCSGLTMQAWAAAGVSIPRTSYDQMSSLPAVSTSELQPGDILGFSGNSHVGIYVGGGYLIDAPVPGQNVQKIALSGWYSQNLDGAVRP